jgi:hypothetical protein
VLAGEIKGTVAECGMLDKRLPPDSYILQANHITTQLKFKLSIYELKYMALYLINAYNLSLFPFISDLADSQ